MKNSSNTQLRSSVTIPNNTAVSNALNLDDRGARGLDLQIPDAWTAADIVFEFSTNEAANGTWHQRRVAGGDLVRCTGFAANDSICGPGELWGAVGSYRYMRLRSVAVDGTSDVNQGADRTIIVFLKF